MNLILCPDCWKKEKMSPLLSSADSDDIFCNLCGFTITKEQLKERSQQ